MKSILTEFKAECEPSRRQHHLILFVDDCVMFLSLCLNFVYNPYLLVGVEPRILLEISHMILINNAKIWPCIGLKKKLTSEMLEARVVTTNI